MDVIRESPLTQAHFYWRCAEQSSSNAGMAAGYRKVVRQLELVRAVSRDDQIQSLLQKQIEFHQRRVSLLRMHNGEEPETDLVESEEDISIVREDLEELQVPDSPEETEASSEVDAPPYKEIEESNSCAAEDNVGDSDTCLLERIERLEKENLNLKLSLQQEREKNAALTRKIAEIRNDVSYELK